MSNTKDSTFYTIEESEIKSLKDLNNYIKDLTKEKWAYRAQPSTYPLQTTFERECLKSGIPEEERAKVEEEMIRQFKRAYDGIDRQDVISDTLYCISLMRHYGAPVRLLDFTYSNEIVKYFALEEAYNNVPRHDNGPSTEVDYSKPRDFSIWSMDTGALLEQLEMQEDKWEITSLMKKREKYDEKRKDSTFKRLYLEKSFCFVSWENPIKQHERLRLQQGVFLCPGDITKPFMENLRACYTEGKTDKIRMVKCSLQPDEIQKGLEECGKMNISRESLFPGLDGFASAMSYQVGFFQNLYKWRNAPRNLPHIA
ncbi:MAG: FRG domain-containing protein [Chloroflexota bacterium]